ncbi:MAG: phosphoglucomutase/phosphomannomutase family protein, partial [Deltaproteobacteria bacterium]|nr:phosphoglucomutase/phosphomannomutase family protein [Deltaproteobacteria bacterium]
AEVLAGNGLAVEISDQYCPTPCVSWMVKDLKGLAGVMITASHNPWAWNGVKFKESYGGSASPEYIAPIEKRIIDNEKEGRKIQKINFDAGEKKGLITRFSPRVGYVHQLKKLVDIEAIKKSKIKILNDPLFGAGTHFLKVILGDMVGEIHTEADPKFGGLNPEPIDKNLGELMAGVKKGGYTVGIATDGDADRIGAVDEQGNFVNSHQIFALLLKHYVEDKKLKGAVIKSVTATEMISVLGKKYKIPVIETPVGFKYICSELVKHNALMGGEESGGISFAPHVHERDGILNGLMLLEMMAQRKKNLKELIDELYREIGAFYFDRVDLHLERGKIENLTERLASLKIEEIAGHKVAQKNPIDGFKYILDDSSWLMIRASGTEPLVRIYAEAGSMERVKKLLDEGKKIVSQ